jgi:hypothetical protein
MVSWISKQKQYTCRMIIILSVGLNEQIEKLVRLFTLCQRELFLGTFCTQSVNGGLKMIGAVPPLCCRVLSSRPQKQRAGPLTGFASAHRPTFKNTRLALQDGGSPDCEWF